MPPIHSMIGGIRPLLSGGFCADCAYRDEESDVVVWLRLVVKWMGMAVDGELLDMRRE